MALCGMARAEEPDLIGARRDLLHLLQDKDAPRGSCILIPANFSQSRLGHGWHGAEG